VLLPDGEGLMPSRFLVALLVTSVTFLLRTNLMGALGSRRTFCILPCPKVCPVVTSATAVLIGCPVVDA